ncbi:MAG TPA: M28 family peptidase [Acidimicrobiales bacterium]|nr:M28 family peptidase [Acidimicrobiales bacterium]
MRKYRGARPAALVLLVSVVAAAGAEPAAADDIRESQGFRRAVTVDGIREHQLALQQIADANGGTRAVGTPGFDASVGYIVEKATAAGYDVSLDEFTFVEEFIEGSPPVLQETAPEPQTFVPGTRPAFDGDFVTFTGTGDVTAPVQAVDLVLPPTPAPNGSTSACEAEDFAGFTPGNIALIQRGTCPYVQKAANAQEFGASAIILFNEGQPGRTAVPNNLPLGAEGVHIPGVGTSFAVGVDLSDPGTVARVKTETDEVLGSSVNVIAETPGGDPHRTVVIGAHLDSVPAGPGINDNGSGSGGILEIAETYAQQNRTPRNKLRFMWYGAEEIGLVGSTKYVEGLSQAEKDDILAMLNFDMIGSPNFARMVYDGDGTVGPEGPTGSGLIEDVFLDYFASQGLFNEPTAFDGRSDYGPFIAEGIPAGGLFTGAEVPKTAAQVAQYGGIVDAQLDPCYHAPCDTFAGSGSGAGATAPGLGLVALDQMSDAAAHAVLFFSKTKLDVRNTPN